ncbi:MAG TPA: DNA cytosine methyltransferase [Acidimicrobiales bacterium]
MRIGSLFAGIGGLELGLERAGVGHTVWQVEKDDYCRRVLSRHWPDAVRYEDVTTVDWSTVEPVEVLCGGFPCQDISLAGKGAGLAGERSGLWREYLRAIRALRPRFVVVENVAALLARGLGDVLADLAASGYDTEWDCIPAAAVGAPHRRDRLFVLADADGGRVYRRDADGGDGRAIPAEGQQRLVRGSGRSEGAVAHAASEGLEGTGLPGRPAIHRATLGDPEHIRRNRWSGEFGSGWWREPSDPGWWATEPDVGRVAHGVPSRVDRLRALGNAVVPQVAEVVGHRILAHLEEVAA